DYLPEMLEADRLRFPRLDQLRAVLGALGIQRFPIPRDCADGFLGAYWGRPEAYLDPSIRGGISSLDGGAFAPGLARLAADLSDGTWVEKHGHVLDASALDLGYCLVSA